MGKSSHVGYSYSGKIETLGSNFSQETAPLATGVLCYNRQSLLTNGLSSNHAKLKRLFVVAIKHEIRLAKLLPSLATSDKVSLLTDSR